MVHAYRLRMASASPTFIQVAELIVQGDTAGTFGCLREDPKLATAALCIGATRASAKQFFFREIGHYVYGGDTLLHVAAAAHSPAIATRLLELGADCRARNRRGAEPLHYAADGNPLSGQDQADVIALIVSAGGDPNATDKSGVAPLHRAVRCRSLAAVRALLDAGADVRLPNRSGSTPLFLAVRDTGKRGSGTPEARQRQAAIVEFLQARGAGFSDPRTAAPKG
jgi:ankyrin repeat protein